MKKIWEIAESIKSKEIRYGQLDWTLYTTGYDFGVDDAYKALTEIYENKEHFQIIQAVRGSALSVEDRRRVDILYKSFEPYHLSEEVNALLKKINEKTNSLSQILNQHRTIFEGAEISSVEIAQILAKEENRERRKAAFFARNQVNTPLCNGGFIELLNMRKELARLRGKVDFVALKLEEDELSPAIFSNWKNEIKEILPQMKAIRLKYAQQYLNDDQIMPWDESYIAAQLAPALNEKVEMSSFYEVLKSFFVQFGFDLSNMNITYDVFSRANKSEWGYNFPIEAGKDSRILANVKDQFSEYEVLLHETGHGIHSFMTDPTDYLMDMGISGIISEGIANLFGDFLYNSLFFEKFFTKEKVEDSFTQIKEWHKINAFRAIHLILFDQALYQNQIQNQEDIEFLFYTLREELFEESSFGENPPWAFKIHHTTHPIYLHNYFMGDVTCAMLEKVFKERTGYKAIHENPKAFGAFLSKEVMSPSGRLPFPELFKSISGSPFSLKYLF